MPILGRRSIFGLVTIVILYGLVFDAFLTYPDEYVDRVTEYFGSRFR